VSEVRSPCVGVCTLDRQDVCQGCYRSGREITDWYMAGEEEKREILRRAGIRRAAARRVKLA